MILMIVPLFVGEFGFFPLEFMFNYLIGNLILLVFYYIFWVLYSKSKSLDKAQCTQSRGEAPKQLQGFDLDFSNLSKKNDRDIDLDFDNYGTEGYNDDEYDPSSYSIDDNY